MTNTHKSSDDLWLLIVNIYLVFDLYFMCYFWNLVSLPAFMGSYTY